MSDFTGFTFNTGNGSYTSKSLGITRVSEGDRYKDSLVPEIEDKTVEIPGLDGAYFYGSNFKTRTISLSIAFDEVTEKQLRDMRQVFGYKHTGELIFNEWPYKKYLVKVAQPLELEYVCFDERKKTEGEEQDGIRFVNKESTVITINPDTQEETEHLIVTREREKITPWRYEENTERIYKGEGSIEFIAYYPFAKQVAKLKSKFEESECPNIDEWWDASGLLESYSGIDTYDGNTGAINVYNPGDVETGFRLVIPFNTTTVNEVTTYSLPSFTIKYVYVSNNMEKTLATLNVQEITRDSNDVSTAIQINTMNGLIEGVYKDTNTSILPEDINSSLITSGTIFNEYATGEFFKLLPCEENEYKIKIIGLNNETPVIYYDYLYF